MVTNDQILSQEDVDALLAGADIGGEPSEETTAGPEPGREESDRKTVHASTGRSESEAREILAALCRKAIVVRDEGVRIIWNAMDSFPLSPGFNMEIQGHRYVSLGSISNAHLVVGQTD